MNATAKAEKNAGGFHPMIADPTDAFKGSGREDNQLHSPVVSVNDASEDSVHNLEAFNQKQPEVEFEIIDNAADFIPAKDFEPKYPIHTLELGQGMFIPTPPNRTTDSLIEEMYPMIHEAKVQYSELDRNEHGDTILEPNTVETRQKNSDGTFKLKEGKVVVGADFSHMQRYSSYRNWVVKAVTKDMEINENTKAPADGVLIIRVL